MRIHRLEFTGIGPFRDRQEIDFDRLTASGVFLIDGPTGAGKTTIIDAIVFALYGDVSGREADDSRLRSAYALPTEPSEVICEFSVGDRRQWVRRTPRYMRPKVKGNGLTAEPATQLLREFDREGSLRVELTHASEIGAHISSLLGMSAQQFRQLVVLPQGEFAELLRMKPAERFTALGPLLGDEFYRALQDEIELRGAAARARRISVDEAVHDVEQQFIGALGDLDLAEVGEAAEAFADESLTSQVRLGAAGAIAAWVSIRE
ncbi:MAG: AAA family ATPase, partial [Candidatus Nanopelagicales bacterium]